jgi:hypothetical protein
MVKRVRIPFQPQDYQLESLNNPSRFKVIIRGRRGGKTEEELQGGIRDTVRWPGLHWIVGPSYRQIKSIAWTRLKSILRGIDGWKPNEQELYMENLEILDDKSIPTRLELKGSDKEDSLVGVGLRSLRVDEAALVKRNVWENILRPMLSDYEAPAAFYSTPRGRNWLYDLYMKGVNQELNWASWRQPTAINKYISPQEIENAKKDMSERLFRQEYMAEFLDDDTGVFRRVRQCIVGDLLAPIVGRFYAMGVDLGKSEDFTVLVVLDSVTREVVAFERFRDISWVEQKIKIQRLAHKYNNALVIVDSTGVGDPVTEDLQQANVSLYYDGDKPGYKFTNESKNRLINQLVMAIEQRLVTFPRELETLIQELMEFEYEITTGGRTVYNAPEGKHDDCVIALALANWAIRTYTHEAQVMKADEEEILDRQGHGTPVEIEQAPNISGY